jgi:hypothetical protein
METRQGEGQDKIAGVIFSFIWFIIIYNFSCFKIQGLLFICRDSQNTALQWSVMFLLCLLVYKMQMDSSELTTSQFACDVFLVRKLSTSQP